MGQYMEEPGSILVVSEKPEISDLLKNALGGFVRKISHVKNMNEARRKIMQERIFLLLLFSSPSENTGIDDVIELADRKLIPSVLTVAPEIYPQTVYRAKGRRIYVLTYPIKKGMLIQTVNILYESQMQLYKMMLERDRLQEKLTDMSVISRAKLLLIEKTGMTEEEAHHTLEKDAMDAGITRRKAAEYVIQRLSGTD